MQLFLVTGFLPPCQNSMNFKMCWIPNSLYIFQDNIFKLSKKLRPPLHVHSQMAFGSSRINISLSIKMAQIRLVRQQISFPHSNSLAFNCANMAQMYLGWEVKHSVQIKRVLTNIMPNSLCNFLSTYANPLRTV